MMDDTVEEEPHGGVPNEPLVGTSQTDLHAELVVSATQPAELVVFPVATTEFERSTRWIVATEGSFVSLEDLR